MNFESIVNIVTISISHLYHNGQLGSTRSSTDWSNIPKNIKKGMSTSIIDIDRNKPGARYDDFIVALHKT